MRGGAVTTDERNLRAIAMLVIAVGLGVLALLLGGVLAAALGLDVPSPDAPSFDLPVNLKIAIPAAMVAAGIVWLLLLRSGDLSWEHALREHQIQGFNGMLLVGIGLQEAARTVADLAHADMPMPQAMTVLGWIPVWILLFAFDRKIRPPGDGSARRR